MIKTILVPASGTDADDATFAAALAAARLFDAHLDVLHVRVDAVEASVAMSTDPAAGTVVGGFIERLEQDAAERAARARKTFDAFCARETLTVGGAPGAKGVSAEWHVETGQEPRWFATYGQAADLVVAPRGSADDSAAPRALLEAVLVESGRPVLIPAAGQAFGASESIAIGWKPERQCARAVAAAMPFITRAKTVTVLCIAEGETGERDEADRLVRNLAWHGVSAGIERLKVGPDGAAATLLAAARKAGLLVMGGYGHSRVREWVFGGFTQRALADASVPVLMVH